MRNSLVAALIAVVVLVGIAVLLFKNEVAEPKPAPNLARPADEAGRASDFSRIEAELERLSAEVRRLNRERAESPIVPRSVEDRMPGSRPANTPGEVMPLPARWYLDQYVLSFDGGGTGSEYFRLAVDAYARELVEPIAALVVDAGRPDVLRQKLVAILGTPRFSGNSFVINVFISLIQAGEPRNLALIALKALPTVGGPGTVAVLEPLVWSVRTDDLAVAVLRTIAQLAGNGVNASLLRILTAASGTQIEVLRILMSLLNGSDPESALQCFVRASTMSQPIRLVAAHRIADFTDDPFKQYVAKWLGFETDPQVREVLERASKQQGSGKSWSAARAVGPPDANPDSDDPNAWASAKPDGGREWLELGYSTPLVASSVRIYEVNARGAVAEVQARDSGGTWHTLWSGTTSASSSGPLTLEFSPTSFAVTALRIVLDTTRSPSWNEIDAVELVGPQGRAWATDGKASSSYSGG